MLFVCRLAGAPGPRPEIGATLILLETPHGLAAQAFESKELASFVWQFYGAAEGVFVLPEAKLTVELRSALEAVPVVVYRTMKDYDGATLGLPQFPWLDRLIRYAAEPTERMPRSSEA